MREGLLQAVTGYEGGSPLRRACHAVDPTGDGRPRIDRRKMKVRATLCNACRDDVSQQRSWCARLERRNVVSAVVHGWM